MAGDGGPGGEPAAALASRALSRGAASSCPRFLPRSFAWEISMGGLLTPTLWKPERVQQAAISVSNPPIEKTHSFLQVFDCDTVRCTRAYASCFPAHFFASRLLLSNDRGDLLYALPMRSGPRRGIRTAGAALPPRRSLADPFPLLQEIHEPTPARDLQKLPWPRT